MKLLFIGLEPTKEFQRTVVSHGFSCVLSSKIPPTHKSQPYEMVVVSVSNLSEIKQLGLIRRRFPDSWMAVVIKESNLLNSDFHSSLIEDESKDAVWLEGAWEMLFWFSFQQMMDSQRLSKRVGLLEKEMAQFQQKTSVLSEASNKLIDKFRKDIDLAENIQRILRPRFSPQIPGISLSVKYIPSLEGGGDYYDVFEFGDKKRFGILLADSKTHGMAAALLSVLLKLRLEEMKDRFPDAKSFMSFLNREIRSVHTSKNEASMALFYGILDRASLSFKYSSAGGLKPILWRAGGVVPVSSLQNPEVGGVDYFEFQEQTLQLQPRDLLILHTNGLEAPLKKRGMTGEDRILNLLKHGKQIPDPLETQNELMGVIDEYTSKKKLKDDLTLIQLAVDERAIYVARAEGD